jgi:DNA-binding NarL/FixJ family response regulator
VNVLGIPKGRRICCKCGHAGNLRNCWECGHERCSLCQLKPLKTTLSTRELAVAEALGRGDTMTRIGKQLGISTKTVSTHAMRAAAKLGLKDALALRIHMVEKRVREAA